MKKYILLGIPLLLYRQSYLFLSLEGLINLVIILFFVTFFLGYIKFINIFDWIIGVCFILYFCLLYSKTIYFRGFILEDYHYSSINLRDLLYTVNFIPIKGIINEIKYHFSPLYQIVGNIIMLSPLVFAMLYFKWVKNYKKVIGYSLACTIGIEFIQLLQNIFHKLFIIGLSRSIDIDDIILNMMGVGIGIGFYHLWLKVETNFISPN